MACNSCPPIFAVRECPVALMATFKALGVSHLYLSVLENGKYTQAQWRAAAVTAGLKYIDYPSASISGDEADPNLVAYVLKPEFPDRLGTAVSVWQSQRDAIRTAGSTKPILGMFSGSNITIGLNTTPPYQGDKEVPFLPLVDWVAEDWMPINSDPNRYATTIIGNALVNLGSWSGGKPALAQIETVYSNFSANGRLPTTDEMKSECRTAFADPGTMGIVFNIQVQQGGAISFSYDGTSTAMKTAISEIITELAPNTVVTGPAKTVAGYLYDDGSYELL